MSQRAPEIDPDRVVEDDDNEPDYDGECEVCGGSPVMPLTGMCGPCSTGEADTVDGNW